MNNTTKRWVFDTTVWTSAVMMTFVLLIHDVAAESRFPPVANDKWQAECGSCHIAYPPQLLPAASWRRVMSELDKHFGADASLDAASAAGIGEFLESNAARGKRAAVAAGTLRITEAPWFRREHREIEAPVWKSAGVKTPANCGACHTTAERGDFSERGVRVPR